MTIYLRADEPPLDDATVLIHMGAGHARDAIRGAIRNYAAYKVLRGDGYGYFTVSVYAIKGRMDERQIVTAMHHGLFARAPAGAIRAAGFALLPTSDDDLGDEAGDGLRAIQEVHYDVVLPLTDDLRHIGPPHPDTERLVSDQLRLPVARLLALMPERVDKYARYPRGDAR